MIAKCNPKYICCEDISLIENYEEAVNDKENIWVLHHRLENHPDGSLRFTHKSLKKLGLYVQRPACELIFLRIDEHRKLENDIFDDERKEKLSKRMTGEGNPFYGKHHSEETRKRWSEIRKGRPNKIKGKHNCFKGMKWKLIDGKRVWFTSEGELHVASRNK